MIEDVIRWVLILPVALILPGLAVAALVGEMGERSRPTPDPWDNET